MLLPINADSKIPLYVQIYQILKEKIHNQKFQTNEKLPSKRNLARANNISENTVTSAYEQLAVEGYIYSIERKGYYVSTIEFHNPLSQAVDTSNDSLVHGNNEAKKHFLFDFTRSNPDQEIFPFTIFSKLYRQLFQKANNQLISEVDGQGLYPLRKQLQHYLSVSRGVPCSPEQIILGPSTESLLIILFQLIDEELVVGLEDPGYQGFQQLLKRYDISYFPIAVNNEELDITTLANSLINLMIVTSNHQFPTGYIMPLKQRQSLLQWANQADNRYIIENDYDSEFKYSGIPIPSLKYLDKNNRVIHIGSFTRVLSPGIRLSYMVLPNKLVEKYQETFLTTSSSLSTLEQWVIHDFIKEGYFSAHLNRSRTFYKRKRDLMIHAIHQNDPQAKIFGEKAGLHLLVEPSTPFDGTLFKKKASEKGIKLNLLSDYSFTEKEIKEKIIFLSFSRIPEEEMTKVIKILFNIIQLTALK